MPERSPSRASGLGRRRDGGQICAQAGLPARHPSAPEATCQSTAEHLLSYIPQIDDGTYGNGARSKRNSASHSGCAEPPDGTVHYRDKFAGVSLRARRLKAKRFAPTFPGWTGQAAAAKPMPVAPPTIQRHFPWRSSIVPDCLCVDNGLGKARNQWRRTIGENWGLGCSRQPRAWDPRCRSVLRFTSFPAELPWGRLGGALDI